MLEGREVTVKKFSEVFTDNPTKRLDSQFFKKEYVSLLQIIHSNKCEKLQSLSSWITQGPNPTFDEDGKIPCLTGRNINKGRVNYNNPDYVNEKEYKDLERFQLKIGDTLITLKGKGSIGKIGYVTDSRPAIFSRDIGIIRPVKINPAFVNAYILSKFGVKIIERGETGGTGQTTLTTSYLKGIDIPRFKIEKEIGSLIAKSERVLEKSQNFYNQAENLLLEAVGLKDFEPSKEKTNVKNFKESFLSTGRLDAEYYQPKYEQVVNHIKQKNGAKLVNLVDIKKSIEPGSAHYSDEGLPFLRVADYNKFGITEPNKKLSPEFCVEHAKLIEALKLKRNTILFSKDGSVGTAYRLREDLEMITSGAVLQLTIKGGAEVLHDYLTLALNSKLIQMQAERDAGGSIILHWRTEEIENVIVPIVAIEMQEKIGELIEESFRLKKESENLLEIAKRAVEIAIEETEEKAIEFIEESTQ